MLIVGSRFLQGRSFGLLRNFQSTLAATASKRDKSVSQANGFLPGSYSCASHWDNYLRGQLQEFNIRGNRSSELLIAAKDHAVKGGKFDELDIDTLAIGIGSGFYDEAELDGFERNILPAFRRGPRASEWISSTPAIISRAYTDRKYFKRLRNLVGNKKDFGVFPDHISYSLLINALISQDQKEDAAYFAVEWMLQEEHYVSKLANTLSLLACWQQGLLLDKFEVNLSVPGENDEDEQIIRVNFLINPYNDLHFDLVSEHHRVGKTLFVLGKLLGNTNCSLLGSALFERYQDSVNLIKSSNDQLSVEALDKFEHLLGVAETREDAQARWKPTMDQHIDRVIIDRKISKEERVKLTEEFKAIRGSLGKRLVTDTGLVAAQLSTLIQKAVDEEAQRDISVRQVQLSKEWPELRRKLLKEQVFQAGRLDAIASSRQQLSEIKDKMETLAYFQRKDEIGVRQVLGDEAARKAEEEKVLKEKERNGRRWKKPEVKREEARPNVGIYPVTGV